MARRPNGKINVLSRDEGRALLDQQARTQLGMSGDEFIRRWNSGKFDKNRDKPEVVRVSMLLAFAR